MPDRRTLIRALALAALAFPALAAAQPAAPRVAALSLVGDRLLVVGSQMSTGSRLDRNAREVVALPDDGLDIAAAREAERAAKAIRPGLDIVPIGRAAGLGLRQLACPLQRRGRGVAEHYPDAALDLDVVAFLA